MSDDESRKERAAKYRKMAADAERFASVAKLPASRIEYLKLAAGWRALADQLERERYTCPTKRL